MAMFPAAMIVTLPCDQVACILTPLQTAPTRGQCHFDPKLSVMCLAVQTAQESLLRDSIDSSVSSASGYTNSTLRPGGSGTFIAAGRVPAVGSTGNLAELSHRKTDSLDYTKPPSPRSLLANSKTGALFVSSPRATSAGSARPLFTGRIDEGRAGGNAVNSHASASGSDDEQDDADDEQHSHKHTSIVPHGSSLNASRNNSGGSDELARSKLQHQNSDDRHQVTPRSSSMTSHESRAMDTALRNSAKQRQLSRQLTPGILLINPSGPSTPTAFTPREGNTGSVSEHSPRRAGAVATAAAAALAGSEVLKLDMQAFNQPGSASSISSRAQEDTRAASQWQQQQQKPPGRQHQPAVDGNEILRLEFDDLMSSTAASNGRHSALDSPPYRPSTPRKSALKNSSSFGNVQAATCKAPTAQPGPALKTSVSASNNGAASSNHWLEADWDADDVEAELNNGAPSNSHSGNAIPSRLGLSQAGSAPGTTGGSSSRPGSGATQQLGQPVAVQHTSRPRSGTAGPMGGSGAAGGTATTKGVKADNDWLDEDWDNNS